MPRFFAGSRGEYADRPLSIPWRGWWQVLKRVREEVVGDRRSIIAAGIAYYALFSVFPAIAMLIMIYGLVSDAETARQQLEAVRGILPEDADNLLSGPLARVSNAGGGPPGFGLRFTSVRAAWTPHRPVPESGTQRRGKGGGK